MGLAREPVRERYGNMGQATINLKRHSTKPGLSLINSQNPIQPLVFKGGQFQQLAQNAKTMTRAAAWITVLLDQRYPQG
jgi:hypothetical protein